MPEGSDEGVRRPLTHVEGSEERFGDTRAAADLAAAFDVAEEDREEPVRGVHGLHPYPARLHPSWVRGILGLVHPDANVYDPFCGSGTVLVEAQRQGRLCRGSDVNEVALRVAYQRTSVRSQAFLNAFWSHAERIHDAAAERRETRFGALAKGEDRFPRHVLGPLIALRDEIEQVQDPELREALLIAGLSPLFGKFAARPGRKAPEVGRNAARTWFLRRCRQACESWDAHSELVHPDTPRPLLEKADARETCAQDHTVETIITSPPYPGVYDYVAEQDLRAKWLGNTEWMRGAAGREIGRRDSNRETWAKSMGDVLLEFQRITRNGANIFLVVGDGAVAGKAVRVDKILRTLIHTRKLPFDRRALVSRARPHFHGPSRGAFADRARREHLLWLRRR